MLRLTDVIIDCPDALALAGFYSAVTGVPVKPGSTQQWAGLTLGDLELAFTSVAEHRRPRWPDPAYPQQFHLDFEVDDLDAEQARVLALGADLLRDHGDAEGYGFRVFADPAGHPFCLCRNRAVTWVDERPVWPSRA